tara:strand:- start:536 stop:703 length:168 start_codon:yes stop_codon:yes gene_type:complete
MNEEEYKLKVAIDRLLTAISSGAALSDLMRMASKTAVYVGWPFVGNNDEKGDEEE